MTFSSSRVVYPQGSSPPIIGQKRKLFQTWGGAVPKRRKMLCGFVLDEEDEEEYAMAREQQKLPPCATTKPALDGLVSEESNLNLDRMASGSLSPSLPPPPFPGGEDQPRNTVTIQTSSGRFVKVTLRPRSEQLSYQQTIAQRSSTVPGRAKKGYYGIEIHKLLDEHKSCAHADIARRRAKQPDAPYESIEQQPGEDIRNSKSNKHQMWTEKYRARKFTELIGDERTHRSVLRWLKAWDPIVFPGSTRSMANKKKLFADHNTTDERSQHRKILLLTGPPGLGKTTMAHVCAKQAGYETLEINASDERNRDVVKGRIRDAVGTENVRGIHVVNGDKKTRKAGRPVCVVVDEVDGVVSGSAGAGGEGGFMKALIDLVQLDQRNSQSLSDSSFAAKKTKKSDRFRLLRPLILVCNDLYAPALRALRTSSCAEIVHVRKPPLEKAVGRLASIFEKEGIAGDMDAIRRLCEASWGIGGRKQGPSDCGNAGDGDIRGILVQGEMVAHKLRSTGNAGKAQRLTKAWIEENILHSDDNNPSRGLGRGGLRETIERVFTEGAGLPHFPAKTSSKAPKLYAGSTTASIGISELRKRAAITSIREMVDTLGEHDRVMSDCFTSYPSQVYQDDTYMTKPVAAYDWLYFHDMLSSRVFGGQEWELNPYLSQSACAFHHLFAAVNSKNPSWEGDDGGVAQRDGEAQLHPFTGPRADFAAYEAEKANRAIITGFQSSLSGPLLRLYSSTDSIAAELIPNVARMLAPDVKPVVVGGSGGQGSIATVRKPSEKNCIRIASRVMSALKVNFERVRVEVEGGGGGGAHGYAGFALRMDPPLDSLATFESWKRSANGPAPAPVRYAVRQVLEEEHRKDTIRIRLESRLVKDISHGRPDILNTKDDQKEDAGTEAKRQAISVGGKRDFFGRILNEVRPGSTGKGVENAADKTIEKTEGRVWVSFHEGYSNAVRKPISLKEFLDSL